jgi:hypothetical protein
MIPIHAPSKHPKNYFGNLLLEFCKYNNMFICNGRMFNDKGVGKFTSKYLTFLKIHRNSFQQNLVPQRCEH